MLPRSSMPISISSLRSIAVNTPLSLTDAGNSPSQRPSTKAVDTFSTRSVAAEPTVTLSCSEGTDAISVACKALGIAADIYYEKDPETKYAPKGNDDPPAPTKQPMTFEAAKDIRLVSTDEYNGMTLTEICKVNREYFNRLGNEGTDIVREACAAIVEYIKASKEKKNG